MTIVSVEKIIKTNSNYNHHNKNISKNYNENNYYYENNYIIHLWSD